MSLWTAWNILHFSREKTLASNRLFGGSSEIKQKSKQDRTLTDVFVGLYLPLPGADSPILLLLLKLNVAKKLETSYLLTA